MNLKMSKSENLKHRVAKLSYRNFMYNNAFAGDSEGRRGKLVAETSSAVAAAPRSA